MQSPPKRQSDGSSPFGDAKNSVESIDFRRFLFFKRKRTTSKLQLTKANPSKS